MIAADDNIIPVLAYSTESSFDYSKIAPAARDWVDGYKNEIAASITTKYPAQAGTAEQWAALMSTPSAKRAAKTTIVGALMSSKWDQAPYYNANCPAGTPTGCVATSIAQVMRYWTWPTIGSGYHTYKPASYSSRNADFGDTAYNWTSMPLTSSTTHVAKLMADVGVAVDMNYGTTSSGAYTLINESPIINCSEYALKTYFHYKRSIHGVLRYSDYTGVSTTPAGTWGLMLKTDIDASRPILYSGHGPAGGHAWVCDGYDASNKFHFNWGWSGSGPDGYYTVDNLNPPSLGIGGGGGAFNVQQAVIMGIEPDSFSAVKDNLKLLAHVDHKVDMPATYPVPAFSVNTKVINTNATAYNGDFTLQVYDTVLKYFMTFNTVTGKSIAPGDNLALTFTSTSTLYQLVPGYYKLRVLYRPTGGSTWSLVGDNGTFINENALAVNNSQAIRLSTAITLSTGTSVKIGAPLTVNARIYNASSASTFNGDVKAIFTNVATGTQTQIGATASDFIATYSSGITYAFTTPSVSVPAGIYAVAIQHKAVTASAFTYSGSDYYQNPVLVTVGYGGGYQYSVTFCGKH